MKNSINCLGSNRCTHCPFKQTDVVDIAIYQDVTIQQIGGSGFSLKGKYQTIVDTTLFITTSTSFGALLVTEIYHSGPFGIGKQLIDFDAQVIFHLSAQPAQPARFADPLAGFMPDAYVSSPDQAMPRRSEPAFTH